MMSMLGSQCPPSGPKRLLKNRSHHGSSCGCHQTLNVLKMLPVGSQLGWPASVLELPVESGVYSKDVFSPVWLGEISTKLGFG